ncbi:MAG: LysR family transcriptional regulator [Oscillospiraceae bacterium]|nr:LysR family transcriptional regulator [Oscillospiraceae bacterium]
MTINQIHYFIATAKCLNFTKAADRLHMTPSALSRQISSMEYELNLQLFVRTQRFVKLTPAGKTLFEAFERIEQDYSDAVSMAQNAQYGMSGNINVGILDGTRIDDLFPPVIRYFAEQYPSVNISLRNFSFNDLVSGLYDGSLDFAVTLLFDIAQHANLHTHVIEKTQDWIVVPANHPLANRNRICLADLRDEIFIIVAHEDSSISSQLIISACKAQGFVPHVRFSPSIQTSMLWLQAGMGVAMFDTRNILYENPNVVFLDVDSVSDPSLTLAWSQDNQNPYSEKFLRIMKESIPRD